MSEASEDENDRCLPPEHARPFTSGIRRKPVAFVRSADLDSTTQPSSTRGKSVADAYLSLVMKPAPSTSPSTPKDTLPSDRNTQSAPPTAGASPTSEPAPVLEPASVPEPVSTPEICKLCNYPIHVNSKTPHEALLVHQISLTHSQPPTHLDRTRNGFRYLTDQGWDPDARLGLGASDREGIHHPIKASMKFDTAALGTGFDKDGDPLPRKPPPVKVKKLNARQSRQKAEEEKKKAERMRSMFTSGGDKLLKYLGEGA